MQEQHTLGKKTVNLCQLIGGVKTKQVTHRPT